MTLFLTGLVSAILLVTTKIDFTRYDREEGLANFGTSLRDKYRWKQVHEDVFRQLPRFMIISPLIGTDSQLVILSGALIL
ncbi:Transmembrane 9 super member 3 [Rhizopus stolonifer]|uniref:Transmembrane 9 super member 3 n=1 Tax=Rhizopus stolonifer TaxID=4846 RepID=A0A367KIF1_RHIST|nr:Transmembrane 9 super member 3 [Rhizopus stolonifer]